MPEHEEIVRRMLLILRVLASTETPLTITDLAKETGLNRVVITRLVDAMVNLGLVEKTVGGMPRRAQLRLTAKGRCLLRCFT